jgi:hypothetical protein
MIYQAFENGDVVTGRVLSVASGFFNDGNYTVNQANFSTNPNQTVAFGSTQYDIKNGMYYYNVYYNGQVHFSIAYGDLNGNGSSTNDFTTTQIFPTEANYRTYMNLLLGPTDEAFSFLSGSYNTNTNVTSTQAYTGSSIFVMSFETNLLKSQINAGQLSFALAGTNGTFSFIDDSSILGKQANVYNIISGAIDANNNPVPYVDSNGSVPYQSIGLFYPKNGIIILNAEVINNLVGLSNGVDSANQALPAGYQNPWYQPPIVTPTTYAVFQSCLFNSLVLAGQNGYNMYVVKSELVPTSQYYVRVKNSNYNYTNNPTFISDGTDGLTKGTIKNPTLRINPTTYITTIGLYDDNNELLAVAKLSQPIAKSFDNEYLFKVNLAY